LIQFIVIYSALVTRGGSISTLNDDQGEVAVFNSVDAASAAIQAHDFIKHCRHQILEINI